jgi:hypothetical protein
MKKEILKIGEALSRAEQKQVHGGFGEHPCNITCGNGGVVNGGPVCPSAADITTICKEKEDTGPGSESCECIVTVSIF